MRLYKSQTKNFFYFFYRLIRPIFDPIRIGLGFYGYIWFLRDMFRYKYLDKNARIFSRNVFPILDEKVSFTPFDAHYFYQQLWVFENVLKSKPSVHIDIGSTYQMSGYLSKIVKAIFVDIRPINTHLDNLEIVNGNILNLPFNDYSFNSISCLHVVEHIGLGRYGDNIDPNGTKKACKELSRILAVGGFLYFSTPVGREKICFNSHRVHDPETILYYFSTLKLISFSVVDDKDTLNNNVNCKDYKNFNYGCGMYIFTKESLM